jgi:hypothetical protein
MALSEPPEPVCRFHAPDVLGAESEFLLVRKVYAEPVGDSWKLLMSLEMGRATRRNLEEGDLVLDCVIDGQLCGDDLESCAVYSSSMQEYMDTHHKGRVVSMMYAKCKVEQGSALALKLKGLADAGVKAPVWVLLFEEESKPPCAVPAHFPLRILGAVQGPAIEPTKLGKSCCGSILITHSSLGTHR